MFAKKASVVVKARIGMKEVKVTVLPTWYCANLLFVSSPSLQNKARGKMLAPAQYINFTLAVPRQPSLPAHPLTIKNCAAPYILDVFLNAISAPYLPELHTRTAES